MLVTGSSPTADAFQVWAPGRVNLIGEHTDYNDGLVLPMAIERGITLHVRRRPDRLAVLTSSLDGRQPTAPLDLVRPLERPAAGWIRYPAGVIAGCQRLGWEIPGFDAEVGGDLPVGGGLSSSAALEVAMATALETLCGAVLAPVDKALLCQRAEHEFAGVPCGIMDQFAVACGRSGHALLLDCQDRSFRHVPLADAGVAVLVVDSGVRHDLADGGYAARRAECAAAARRLGVASLRERAGVGWRERIAGLPDPERSRATHVLSEHERTLAFTQALEAGDWPEAGRILTAGHESLRRDFAVSCPAIDALVELTAAVPGVFGCRMTGGGFGGCVVALVEPGRAAAIRAEIRDRSRAATGHQATAFVTRAAGGPTVTRV